MIRRPLDAAGVMDTMHESHIGQLLPRLEAGDAVLARFAEHCLDCKASHQQLCCSVIASDFLCYKGTFLLMPFQAAGLMGSRRKWQAGLDQISRSVGN